MLQQLGVAPIRALARRRRSEETEPQAPTLDVGRRPSRARSHDGSRRAGTRTVDEIYARTPDRRSHVRRSSGSGPSASRTAAVRCRRRSLDIAIDAARSSRRATTRSAAGRPPRDTPRRSIGDSAGAGCHDRGHDVLLSDGRSSTGSSRTDRPPAARLEPRGAPAGRIAERCDASPPRDDRARRRRRRPQRAPSAPGARRYNR